MQVTICQLKPFLSNDKTLELFLHEIFEMLYNRYPQTQFTEVFVTDFNKPQKNKNVITHVLRAPIYAGMWKNSWIQSVAKKIILKSTADVVLSVDNSIQAKTPECLFITQSNIDLAALRKQVVSIISPSLYITNYLIEKGVAAQQIRTVRPWCKTSFHPVEWEVREQTKERFADGKEYILIDVTQLNNSQVIQILKSFSMFKKWQKTSTQIILTGMGTAHVDAEKMLQHYRYRADVKMMSNEMYTPNQTDIISSAWAMLHFPPEDYSGLALMSAMQTETPVITHKVGAIEETIGDAAIYCSIETVEPLAEAMIHLYKNEKLRNQNIQTAKAMLKTSPASGIAEIWQILNDARSSA